MSSPEGYAAQTRAVAVAAAPSRVAWHHREAVQAMLWVGPAVLYLLFFIAYPFVMSLYLSVSNARVGSPEWHFVGLLNFQRIFADPVFWQTVRNSFVFTFASEAIRLIIGLPLAFALNRSFKGKRLVQGLILIPFVIPIALSSLAWKWMFDSLYSVINWMLMSVHLIDYPWQWLGEPGLAMVSVIVLNVWRGFPFSAVWLLTQGGPYNTTHVFGTYAYNIGINAGDIGMGASITLFMFPLLAIFVIVMLRLLRRE